MISTQQQLVFLLLGCLCLLTSTEGKEQAHELNYFGNRFIVLLPPRGTITTLYVATDSESPVEIKSTNRYIRKFVVTRERPQGRALPGYRNAKKSSLEITAKGGNITVYRVQVERSTVVVTNVARLRPVSQSGEKEKYIVVAPEDGGRDVIRIAAVLGIPASITIKIPFNILVDGSPVSSSDSEMTRSLDDGSVVEVSRNDGQPSLSGFRISSSAPVAVFVGHRFPGRSDVAFHQLPSSFQLEHAYDVVSPNALPITAWARYHNGSGAEAKPSQSHSFKHFSVSTVSGDSKIVLGLSYKGTNMDRWAIPSAWKSRTHHVYHPATHKADFRYKSLVAVTADAPRALSMQGESLSVNWKRVVRNGQTVYAALFSIVRKSVTSDSTFIYLVEGDGPFALTSYVTTTTTTVTTPTPTEIPTQAAGIGRPQTLKATEAPSPTEPENSTFQFLVMCPSGSSYSNCDGKRFGQFKFLTIRWFLVLFFDARGYTYKQIHAEIRKSRENKEKSLRDSIDWLFQAYDTSNDDLLSLTELEEIVHYLVISRDCGCRFFSECFADPQSSIDKTEFKNCLA